MHILITAPTEMELNLIEEKISKEQIHEINFHFLVSEVGVLHATASLYHFYRDKSIDLAIQVGLAGSFNKSIPLGSVCIVKNDCIGDSGVFENNSWLDLFDLNLIHKSKYIYKNKVLTNNMKKIPDYLKYPFVNSVTVNQISTNPFFIDLLKTKYMADIETLEGAAFQYFCLEYNIPFIQFRSISNYVGERDKSKWEIKKSVQQLLFPIEKIVQKLKKG
ncbi:MAG: hypothetical protein ORN58_02040 [Sediminibacterium sp.]|nr:hypothetical protein [Sediminibacterium sp.]